MKNLPTSSAKTRGLITVTPRFIRECRNMSDDEFEKALADAKQDPIQKNARVL